MTLLGVKRAVAERFGQTCATCVPLNSAAERLKETDRLATGSIGTVRAGVGGTAVSSRGVAAVVPTGATASSLILSGKACANSVPRSGAAEGVLCADRIAACFVGTVGRAVGEAASTG